MADDGQAPRTMADAVAAGEQVFAQVTAAAALLPKHSEAAAPATLNDALVLVQQQEEERRRREAARREPKGKAKHGVGAESVFPGATIGAGRERSAFWMIVEVINPTLALPDVALPLHAGINRFSHAFFDIAAAAGCALACTSQRQQPICCRRPCVTSRPLSTTH